LQPTIASHLLTAHFPETLHEEILSAVGLQFAVMRAVRNALFREHVLMACAMVRYRSAAEERLLRTPRKRLTGPMDRFEPRDLICASDRKACHRSQSCSRPSQKSALMPMTWARRKAVSGVTERFPLTTVISISSA
jgi:hypothetical protein